MMDLNAQQLSFLSSVRVRDAELSVRAERILFREFSPEVTLASVVGVDRAVRMRWEGWGRKSEREFLEVVDCALNYPSAPVPTYEASAPLQDTLAEQLFRAFLSNPIYNNMPFEDIARQAIYAAREFRRISEHNET